MFGPWATFGPWANLSGTKGGLELVCLPLFLHDFSRKVYLFLYSIN